MRCKHCKVEIYTYDAAEEWCHQSTGFIGCENNRRGYAVSSDQTIAEPQPEAEVVDEILKKYDGD